MSQRNDLGLREEVSRVVVITLDSCRLDTALECRPPFLNSIALLQPARAQSTFTLPAHLALFHGFPPITQSGAPLRNRSWVLSHLPLSRRWAQESLDDIHVSRGANLVTSLANTGYKTVGAGGMRWFEPPILREGFDKFHYWHPERTMDDSGLPFWADEDYALQHWQTLSSEVTDAARWMLFVNAAETHAPYMCTGALLETQRSLSEYRNGKRPLPASPSTDSLMLALHEAQLDALRCADLRIRQLFQSLPAPFHFLVTADHGEAFGEGSVWGHVYGGASVMNVPLWEGLYDVREDGRP